MVWCRGHAEDYEDWRRAGNPGWGWDEVLPAYRALEDNEAGGDDWRGRGGPLFISANRKGLHPLVKNYLDACDSAGLAYTPDFNGERQEGSGTYQVTVRGGRRNSAARAFLRPAMRRANLRLVTGALVTRVLVEQGRAVGIAYRQGGAEKVLRAKAEVILSAGAIGSPQILQLSGIGPGAVLQAAGVPVVLDAPGVGDNLMDHQGINYTRCCARGGASCVWGSSGC
jgi:choline dehydrogenase